MGLRSLSKDWRALLTTRDLRGDFVAGLTVACIAVPLSLAIALASSVPPEVGLITAIVAGVVCALFGGTPLAVSGPAAAMSVLVATIVQTHGMGGLLVVGLGAGLLQLLTGFFGFGKLIRFIPVPVIAGFTAGIGAIIFVGQLPRALGLPPPDQGHVIEVIKHLGSYIHDTHPIALALAALSLAICIFLPRFAPRLPAPLVAVILPTLIAYLGKLDVARIGEIPRSLPPPHLPELPSLSDLGPLMGAIVMVYALASLETLLSSSAIDKLTRGKRHDPDQELVGQGLGNIAVALFGGIPVTGVIARSALNAQAGAKTPRASIIHSIALFLMMSMFASLIGAIPVAALAGVLLSVALRMLSVGEFLALWKASRSEALVYGITFVVIVVGDLIAGVQVGLLAALAIAAIRLSQTRVHLSRDHARVTLQGPVTFLSTASLDPLRAALERRTSGPLIIDARGVTALDVSGAESVIELVERLLAKDVPVAILGLAPHLANVLRASDPHGHATSRLATTEAGVHQLLQPPTGESAAKRLTRGVAHFNAHVRGYYRPLFERLATGQQPHTLLITCSDSRIVPNLVTSTEPGELFIVRNVGNVVPLGDSDPTPTEGAAVEYAVSVLGVTQIVVCGHSSCGAMRAIFEPELLETLPNVKAWLRHVESLRDAPTPDAAGKRNVLLQLQNLRTYPVVAERLASGQLQLHGWFYEVGTGEILYWDEPSGAFKPLAPAPESSSQRPHELPAPPPSQPSLAMDPLPPGPPSARPT